jgi:hypothetical protein
MSTTYKHLALPLDWREAACGHTMTGEDTLPTDNNSRVTCPDCKVIVDRRRTDAEFNKEFMGVEAPTPTMEERQRRAWTVQVVAGDTDLSLADWLHLHGLSKVRPGRHTPPYLNENDDGVFTFHDVHITGCTLEVVPQQSGNVEITVDFDGDGYFTTLHHLDRMDLVRALLHDFHYSPERGGPNDDQD